MIEKPAKEDAPIYVAIIGRYILSKNIYGNIKAKPTEECRDSNHRCVFKTG